MSLKASIFQTMHAAPKTACKFLIQLPGLSTQSLIQVSAASLPYPRYAEDAIYVQSRPVYFPVKPETDGLWSCVLQEDNTMTGAMVISYLLRITRMLSARNLSAEKVPLSTDILIFLVDESTGTIPLQVVTLKEAWLKEIKPVGLDWSKPDQAISYELTFRYSDIIRLV